MTGPRLFECRCPACGSSRARLNDYGRGDCPACQHRWSVKPVRYVPTARRRGSFTVLRKFI